MSDRTSRTQLRIAAMGDLHVSKNSRGSFQPLFSQISESADVLLLCGDFTDYGLPDEARVLVRELTAAMKIPVIAVLGNHDYESGREADLMRMMTQEGIKVLDGSAYERDGVGFAGTKGFVGGFGRGVLTAFGETEIKTFVRAGIDEALKLERAMSQLRTKKRVIILHYSPIAATVEGEAHEIYPFLGTSRLAEVIDRHGADLVLHGHAHNGKCDGKTSAGIPVHNVAITLLQSQNPPGLYRVFDV